MKNTKLFIGSLLGIMVVLFATGCQQSSSSEASKYYVEGGVLSKTELQSIVSPYENRTDLTFDDIKSIRNKIRNCDLEEFFSEKDVSENDCRDFLTQHGFTPSEADKVIESVNEVGNILLFFNVKYSDTDAAYIYAEKQ